VRTGHIGHVIYQGSSAGQFHNSNDLLHISNIYYKFYFIKVPSILKLYSIFITNSSK
jgi:hypothetical protein